MKILQNIHKKRKIIRKRALGMTLAIFVLWLFSSNVESDCVYVLQYKLKHAHIESALLNATDVKSTVKEKKIKVKETLNAKSNLDVRYSNIKYYDKHSYFESVINRDAKLIYDLCKKEGINPSVTMAQYILESHTIVNGKGDISDMGDEKHNYFSVKHKGDDPYYSDEFKALLSECSVNEIHWQKDDEIKNGELVESAFYTFKSKWYGIRAGIGFIGDRVRSNHPQWQHFKNINPSDTKAWAYGIYESGYAKKNVKVPYDKKIMRLINLYDIEDIMNSF
jgi:hypothetical protein